ncbi:MAG: prepilin-type N-terminal cleavage/methylation domain-containing protein [Conexivisphaerales archaeon]
MKKGFTLLEVLVVVLVVSIILLIAVPQVQAMYKRGRIAALTADMRIINSIISTYTADWGSPPPDTEGWYSLKAELTAQANEKASPTINVPTSTTNSGEKGGISYIDESFLDAFEGKVVKTNNTPSIEYKITSNNPPKWFLKITVSIQGQPYKLQLSDGQIQVIP